MITFVKAVPAWGWLAMALVVGVGFQQYRVMAISGELSSEQSAHSNYREEVAERDRAAAVKALIESRRREEAKEKIDNEAQQEIAAAHSDAARAGDALERLQRRFEAVSARSRACGNSITAQLSETADSAARMQADMFGRVGALAKLYAGVADERGIAGKACEASYHSLKEGAAP